MINIQGGLSFTWDAVDKIGGGLMQYLGVVVFDSNDEVHVFSKRFLAPKDAESYAKEVTVRYLRRYQE